MYVCMFHATTSGLLLVFCCVRSNIRGNYSTIVSVVYSCMHNSTIVSVAYLCIHTYVSMYMCMFHVAILEFFGLVASLKKLRGNNSTIVSVVYLCMHTYVSMCICTFDIAILEFVWFLSCQSRTSEESCSSIVGNMYVCMYAYVSMCM
jgi:hypothetical protein